MSRVYLANDTRLGRKIVVKVLPPEMAADLSVERFKREIQVAAQLRHPHIVPLFDAGDANGVLYYTMPLIEGESLREVLTRDRVLPVDVAQRYASEVADALSYAHRAGVIHRDIKPENILIDSGHAVVADFGIARAISQAGSPSLTRTGAAIGTLAYMSPEQLVSDPSVDARSDVYSLGCVLHETLYGVPPVGTALFSSSSRNPALVTPAVRDVILRALAPNSSDRFESADAFASALAAASGPQNRRMLWTISALTAATLIGVAFALRPKADTAFSSPLAQREQVTFTGDARTPALSPDGQLLAYGTKQTDSIYIVDLATRATTAVPSPGRDCCYPLLWASEGTEILYQTRVSRGQKELYSVSRRNGAVRRIQRIFGLISFYSLADNGRTMVGFFGFARRETPQRYERLLSFRTIGDSSSFGDTASVEGLGTLMELQISPDSRRVAAMSLDSTGVTAIIVVNRDGSAPERVAVTKNWPTSVAWTPRGDSVYFADSAKLMSVPVNRRTNRPAGAPTVVLSFHQAINFFALSRDGRRLAILEESRVADIFWGAVGNGAHPVLTQVSRGSARPHDPAISPSGFRIAYAQADQIVMQATRSGAPRPIARLEGMYVFSLSWSADETRLAILVGTEGAEQAVIVIDTTGRQVARHRIATAYGSGLEWSADGRGVAYLAADTVFLGRLVGRFIDFGTGRDTILLGRPDSVRGTPRFSPDGRQLVFASRGRGIVVRDLRTSRDFVLSNDTSRVPQHWGSDGAIFSTSRDDGRDELWRTDPLPDGRPSTRGCRGTAAMPPMIALFVRWFVNGNAARAIS